jgi:hypothetical protein
MCTYLTETISIAGSGKGAGGWFRLTDVTVYFDHPVHALADHTLNIDFANPSRGAAFRVAVELTAASARELVAAIEQALRSAPAEPIAQEFHASDRQFLRDRAAG